MQETRRWPAKPGCAFQVAVPGCRGLRRSGWRPGRPGAQPPNGGGKIGGGWRVPDRPKAAEKMGAGESVGEGARAGRPRQRAAGGEAARAARGAGPHRDPDLAGPEPPEGWTGGGPGPARGDGVRRCPRVRPRPRRGGCAGLPRGWPWHSKCRQQIRVHWLGVRRHGWPGARHGWPGARRGQYRGGPGSQFAFRGGSSASGTDQKLRRTVATRLMYSSSRGARARQEREAL